MEEGIPIVEIKGSLLRGEGKGGGIFHLNKILITFPPFFLEDSSNLKLCKDLISDLEETTVKWVNKISSYLREIFLLF